MPARIRWSIAVLTIAILAPALVESGAAQDVPRPPEPGMAIRFQGPGGGTTEAFWVRQDSARAWIIRRGMASPDTTSVPLADLGRLEGVIGTRSRAGRGAVIGGGVGLALGAVLMLAAGDDGYFTGGEQLGGAILTGAVGAGLGALLGLINPARVWASLQPDPSR